MTFALRFLASDEPHRRRGVAAPKEPASHPQEGTPTSRTETRRAPRARAWSIGGGPRVRREPRHRAARQRVQRREAPPRRLRWVFFFSIRETRKPVCELERGRCRSDDAQDGSGRELEVHVGARRDVRGGARHEHDRAAAYARRHEPGIHAPDARVHDVVAFVVSASVRRNLRPPPRSSRIRSSLVTRARKGGGNQGAGGREPKLARGGGPEPAPGGGAVAPRESARGTPPGPAQGRRVAAERRAVGAQTSTSETPHVAGGGGASARSPKPPRRRRADHRQVRGARGRARGTARFRSGSSVTHRLAPSQKTVHRLSTTRTPSGRVSATRTDASSISTCTQPRPRATRRVAGGGGERRVAQLERVARAGRRARGARASPRARRVYGEEPHDSGHDSGHDSVHDSVHDASRRAPRRKPPAGRTAPRRRRRRRERVGFVGFRLGPSPGTVLSALGRNAAFSSPPTPPRTRATPPAAPPRTAGRRGTRARARPGLSARRTRGVDARADSGSSVTVVFRPFSSSPANAPRRGDAHPRNFFRNPRGTPPRARSWNCFDGSCRWKLVSVSRQESSSSATRLMRFSPSLGKRLLPQQQAGERRSCDGSAAAVVRRTNESDVRKGRRRSRPSFFLSAAPTRARASRARGVHERARLAVALRRARGRERGAKK